MPKTPELPGATPPEPPTPIYTRYPLPDCKYFSPPPPPTLINVIHAIHQNLLCKNNFYKSQPCLLSWDVPFNLKYSLKNILLLIWKWSYNTVAELHGWVVFTKSFLYSGEKHCLFKRILASIWITMIILSHDPFIK